MNLRAIPKRIAVDCVRSAPLGLFSDAVGWGARQTVPRPLRAPLYSAYAACFGAELAEAELPLAEYPSLGSFFARRLRSGLRPEPNADDVVIAPSDGVLKSFGPIGDGLLVQAKGIDYSVEALLADRELASEFLGGYYATIYLSPKDYHRVHSPITGHVTGYQYIPGARLPVNALFQTGYDGLFAKNERVVIRLRTSQGPCAVVMVGATAVGNIRLTYGHSETERLVRGANGLDVVHEPYPVSAGSELGAFHLGSTVVMLLPASIRVDEGLRSGPVTMGAVWAAPSAKNRGSA